ncbi:MAG: ABC transporter ATP-binding protein [Flavobacteriales bacterium]
MFFFCLFFTLSLGLLSVGRSYFIKFSLDEFVDVPNLAGLWQYALIMLGMLMVEALFQFLFSYYSGHLGQSIILAIRKEVFSKLLHFKVSYFDKTPVGTLVTRVVSDIEAISTIFSQGILTLLGDVFKILFILVLMFYINIKISLMIILIFPLLMLATRWFQKYMKKSFDDERSAIGALNTFVQEHIQGMSIVQIFNREHQEFNLFKTINAKHRDATVRSIFYFSIFLPIIEIFSALAIGILVWQGGSMMLVDPEFKIGSIVLYILLINMLFRPVRQLADRINSIQRGLVASERVFGVLDNHEAQDFDSNQTLEDLSLAGDINFQNVDFEYKTGERVLKNLSFSIKANENIAIVGATGAGKSTIISILNRFYDISNGTIQINDQDIFTLPKPALRRKIATVQQDVFLFSGSILDNLKMANDFDDEHIFDAAKAIGIYDYFERLPKGFNFEVRERGGSLSTGQRQLIAFLQAYLLNPDILILDEATASIDSITEQYIQKAFDKLSENRTTIVIAHRLSTIKNADRILVLDQGLLVEEGSHDTLMENKGLYSKLHDLQFE